MNRALLVVVTGVVVAAATKHDVGANDAHQQAAQGSLAELALSEVRNVRSAMPLGAWQAVHPSDSVELYRPNGREEKESDWCARTTGRVALDSGRTARRVAYFCAPPARADAPLPSGVSPAGLRSQCRLGMEWIVALERDIVRAGLLTAHTRASLTTAFGEGDAATGLLWMGSANWLQKVRWKPDGVEVVSAMTAQEFDQPGDPRPGPPRTMVAIAGAASAVTFSWPTYEPTCGTPTTSRCVEFARLDEAITLASMGGAAEAAMRRHLGAFEHPKDPNARATPSERRAFVTDFRDWVNAARGAPPVRRTAALLAAELLLTVSRWQMNVGDDTDSLSTEMRVQLDSLGARFAHDQLGGTYVSQKAWLTEALKLGGGSRAHDLAFLTMAEWGFETGVCSSTAFRDVIARGTEFLRDFPNSTVTREVRLLVGRAHSDIVALASGGAYEAGDTISYTPEAPAARDRAIAEYTTVLGYPNVPADVRRDAWSSAWRLMAGLSPLRTHFYCVYD